MRGNQDLIKAINRNLLLNIIRREGELSRTQLTEISGLSVGAVSQIINELLENSWILETGEGDYTGGRRQVLIKLNPHIGYAIGLKLMENRVVCAITDFECRILNYQEYPLNVEPTPATIGIAIANVVTATLAQSHIERQQCFGIGIGMAGVIYSQSGVVHYSPFWGWRDVHLANLIQSQLGLSTYVENDVNTLTLSEQLFGIGKHHDNFVVVTVGRGIGMGIVINGQLYQGAKGGAGELGHIIINTEMARQGHAEDGTLETFAADPTVLRTTHQADWQTLLKMAQQGDKQANDALALSGEYLGIGIANVINILSPQLVIISGEGVTAGDTRLKPMQDAMQRYTFNGLLDDVEVVIEPTDDRSWARGAASLVISKVFASPLAKTQVR